MNDLVNIKTYDEFLAINEDLSNEEQSVCNRAFVNGGPIELADGTTVSPKEIVKAVSNAFMWLSTEFPTTYTFASDTLTIIFLAHSRKIKTMAVDKHMNLYMNAEFIHNVLKMDKYLIGAVIMHEAFHALFDHIDRSKNWLAAQGRPLNAQTWHDTNLAADVEVNQTLVRTGVIDAERLINEIHGLYLKNKDGDGGMFTNVVPLETILGNESYMKKLREMCPPPVDPKNRPKKDDGKIPTTKEWDKGYKDAWNKIAGLVKKYGAQGTWDVLLKAGLVNGVGEVYTNHEISDVMALEFKQVKTMDEFINENLKQNPGDKGQTYDDGFITAFGKLCSSIYQSLQPADDDDMEGGGGGGGGDQYDSNLKDDELEDIELPGKHKGKGGGGNNGLPGKVIQDGDSEDGEGKDSDNNNNNNNNNNSKRNNNGSKGRGSGGGRGKDDEHLTDGDINGLIDDIEKRSKAGEKMSPGIDVDWDKNRGSSSRSDQAEGIGGTGSFCENGLSDEDLKEAGYSNEDIKAINKVRQENERNNTKEKIENAINKVKRDISKGSALGQFLEAIEVESAKYRNIWKDMLKEFMAQKTRRAGSEKPNGHNDWIRKKSIARGEYGIHRQKTAQDPQDVNVYVDVSGSMDIKLLEVIAQSLVVYTQQFKYSGINICCWASHSNGICKVNDFYKKKKEDVVAEILGYISKGQAQCGGSTNASAIFEVMQDVVVETLNDPKKKRKDDIHVVITDGQFDYQNVENRMRKAIMRVMDRHDVAEKAPKHTFWMIYDMEEGSRGGLKNEIKEGQLIFINSEVVKNNG